jgi:nitrogen fixation/metabolism regulation signal transduction histidine kinase
MGGVVGLALFLALLLGGVSAMGITRPLEVLVRGAKRVAKGDWRTPITASAGGEVAELIAAFNAMVDALGSTREQLVHAERVAAWQEIAKRLAHEIKNPLTPIRMSLETLVAAQRQKSPQLENLLAESAGPMLEEVERLRRTVDAFSNFARLPKPSPTRWEVKPWVEETLALHAAAPGIHSNMEVKDGLWVVADRDQLTQVLVNLLKNAQEAMPSGGGLIVRARSAAENVQLEVEDSGPGIKGEARAQLFTPYFTTKAGGTGLGLAISARICQEHGGVLELDARHEGGCLFRVRIPGEAR